MNSYIHSIDSHLHRPRLQYGGLPAIILQKPFTKDMRSKSEQFCRILFCHAFHFESVISRAHRQEW